MKFVHLDTESQMRMMIKVIFFFFIGNTKAIMTAALSVPISSLITPLEGYATKFKQWILKELKSSVLCLQNKVTRFSCLHT